MNLRTLQGRSLQSTVHPSSLVRLWTNFQPDVVTDNIISRWTVCQLIAVKSNRSPSPSDRKTTNTATITDLWSTEERSIPAAQLAWYEHEITLTKERKILGETLSSPELPATLSGGALAQESKGYILHGWMPQVHRGFRPRSILITLKWLTLIFCPSSLQFLTLIFCP